MIQTALLVRRRLVILRGTRKMNASDVVRNYDGGWVFSMFNNGNVSIGQSLQERRIWNGSVILKIHTSQKPEKIEGLEGVSSLFSKGDRPMQRAD